MKTYSLSEVAAFLCGDSMKSPERWISKQIKSGRFTAIRVGRQWRMTEENLAYNLAVMANAITAKPAAAAPVESGPAELDVPRTVPNGLSARSARRRVQVAS